MSWNFQNKININFLSLWNYNVTSGRREWGRGWEDVVEPSGHRNKWSNEDEAPGACRQMGPLAPRVDFTLGWGPLAQSKLVTEVPQVVRVCPAFPYLSTIKLGMWVFDFYITNIGSSKQAPCLSGFLSVRLITLSEIPSCITSPLDSTVVETILLNCKCLPRLRAAHSPTTDLQQSPVNQHVLNSWTRNNRRGYLDQMEWEARMKDLNIRKNVWWKNEERWIKQSPFLHYMEKSDTFAKSLAKIMPDTNFFLILPPLSHQISVFRATVALG